MLDVLYRAESILFIAVHGDRAVDARDLEDVEAVMRYRHESRQG
jgi:hypothetical protein